MFVYDSKTVKQWDRYTIENEPISSIKLMERAANAVVKNITKDYQKQPVHIFCGHGNNGGDGLAIARILHEHFWQVNVYILELGAKPSPDFTFNLNRLVSLINVLTLQNNDALPKLGNGLIIDCIFGSGLCRPIFGWVKNIVQRLNQQENAIISIDLPSGLYSVDNRSNDLNAIIQAVKTYTFQCPKMSFFYQEYQAFVGDFHILDIGLDSTFKAEYIAEYLQEDQIKLNPKSPFDYKGTNGYLTLIAGNHPMEGAGVLAAKAAFKVGCGYVGWFTNKMNQLNMLQIVPEAMLLDSISAKSTAIAIGPGLGTDKNALGTLEKAIDSNLPIVLDADALHLLSKHQINPPKNSILTPHLGELKPLIGEWSSPEECLHLQIKYAQKHHVYLLQKGAYSKICTPSGKVYINSTGNKYMAKAGMGDTLTGIIGSFLAQGYAPKNALIYGVYLHGMAGDIAAIKMGLSTMASDVCAAIPNALKQLN